MGLKLSNGSSVLVEMTRSYNIIMKIAFFGFFTACGLASAAAAANCSDDVLAGLVVGSGSIEQIDSKQAGDSERDWGFW